MGIGMLRPRRVAPWNKYTHYSLGIQLGKQTITWTNIAEDKTTASKRGPVPQKDPLGLCLAIKAWVPWGEIQPLWMSVWSQYWLHFGYCLHAARSTHTTLKYLGAPNTEKLVPSVFCLHEGKGVYCSTAKIIKWNSLRKAVYVEVWLGAIAALSIILPHNTLIFHFY